MFLGRPISELVPSVLLIALVMVLRGLAEHWRAVVAHGTAARVQKKLRRILYDQVASLGPGTVGRQRSGGLTLSMIDGVEQLETYFGQFLPQFMIALLSPILIFAVVAFVDLPVATGHAGLRPGRVARAGAVAQVGRQELAGAGRRPMPRSPPSSSIRSRAWPR